MKYYYLKRYTGIFYYLQQGKRHYGYRLTYYDNQHKRHERNKRGFNNVKQVIGAKRQARKHIQQLNNSGNMSFKQWSEMIINERKDLRITTYKAYRHLLEENVIPYIGKYKLVNLTPLIYRHKCWEKLIRKGLSANTIKDVNAKVQAVMNEAVNDGLIKHNELKHPNMKKALQHNNRPRKEIMTKHDLHTFNRCLFRHSIKLQAIYYTLERTGMRAGELLGLHWDAINLKKHTVAIKYTRDAYGLRQPKTKTSRRTLIIDNKLVEVLKKYLNYCKKHYHITNKSYVIVGKKGNPLIPSRLSIWLKRLLLEANLKQYVGHFSCHTFRHQFASNMIVDNEINPVIVSRILGHSNPTTTMQIYVQLVKNKSLNIGKLLNNKKK